MDTTSDFRRYIDILEAHEKAYRIDLPYNKAELSPVLSEEAMDLHYGKLHKGYVDRALKGIDYEWNIAGAELHNLFFSQFKAPSSSNKPIGAVLSMIEKEWKSFDTFKEKFSEVALSIKGSGWCYLSKSGQIKVIPNHKSTKGIVLLIDMWEHSYVLDYGSDKEKYLDNLWKIVDWKIVDARMTS